MIKGTIEAKPQVFAAAVAWAAKFVSPRPAVAAQGGMRLTVTDEQMTIETYNENVRAEARVPVTGDGSGEIIVSARLLAELVKTFADKPVSIGADDDDGMALTAGRWSGTLPGIAEEWAADAIVAPEPIGTVDGTAFATMIGQLAAATTQDEKKPAVMHSVHLDFGAGSITGYGTDGYRMARAKLPFNDGGQPVEMSATLYGHVMVDAAAAFVGPDPITVGLGPNVMSMTSPTRSVALRQVSVEGGYTLSGIINQRCDVRHPRAAAVKVADFLMPMKRANLMSGDKTAPVAIEVADGKIWIHAKATDIKRKGAEDVDADYEGPSHTMALNPKYLADALASAPGDTINMAFNEAEERRGRPWHVIVTVPGHDTWTHLLMPIKMPGA